MYLYNLARVVTHFKIYQLAFCRPMGNFLFLLFLKNKKSRNRWRFLSGFIPLLLDQSLHFENFKPTEKFNGNYSVHPNTFNLDSIIASVLPHTLSLCLYTFQGGEVALLNHLKVISAIIILHL